MFSFCELKNEVNCNSKRNCIRYNSASSDNNSIDSIQVEELLVSNLENVHCQDGLEQGT